LFHIYLWARFESVNASESGEQGAVKNRNDSAIVKSQNFFIAQRLTHNAISVRILGLALEVLSYVSTL
jgi:hypothetical protein